MKIAIAYQKCGFKLAESIISLLRGLGHEVLDFSTPDWADDSPDMAYCTGQAILDHNAERAILICGSGMSSCIAANKIKGLYAASCYDIVEAHIARSRYNTNVLCLSDCWTDKQTTLNIVKEWLNTPFSKGSLTIRSLTKLKTIENEEYHPDQAAKNASEK
jgi:RpiB/LacA/LacB family sugar-phosphate isomerase